jgi:PadR family transcriptional regulator PadR
LGASPFPALYRLERQALLAAKWDNTETGQRANFYSVTAADRTRLKHETVTWTRASEAISRVVAAT